MPSFLLRALILFPVVSLAPNVFIVLSQILTSVVSDPLFSWNGPVIMTLQTASGQLQCWIKVTLNLRFTSYPQGGESVCRVFLCSESENALLLFEDSSRCLTKMITAVTGVPVVFSHFWIQNINKNVTMRKFFVDSWQKNNICSLKTAFHSYADFIEENLVIENVLFSLFSTLRWHLACTDLFINLCRCTFQPVFLQEEPKMLCSRDMPFLG